MSKDQGLQKSQAPTPRGPGRPPKQPRWGDAGLDPEKQHRLRREALFRTAAKAFNEFGFYTTTVDDLAKRLNVTKPTLYYYAKDKDAILFECQKMAFDYISDALEEVENGPESGMQKLKDFLHRYAELMANDYGACLIITGLKPLRAESQVQLRGFARQLDQALQKVLAQGIKDGTIRSCNIRLTAYLIFGAFNNIANWYRPDGEFTIEYISDYFLGMIMRSLQPEGA